MGEKLQPKVEALYRAVGELIEEGADINEMTVSDITGRAGIGKGTAYDYFKNKEDIISSAMIWQIDRICGQIGEHFADIGSFAGIVHYVLVCLDEEIRKRDCFVRYVHILSDNGPISKSLQEKLNDGSGHGRTPELLLKEMVETGIAGGEIKETLPRDFMYMEIGARLIAYAMYLEFGLQQECSREQMHGLICDSLLKEFN